RSRLSLWASPALRPQPTRTSVATHALTRSHRPFMHAYCPLWRDIANDARSSSVSASIGQAAVDEPCFGAPVGDHLPQPVPRGPRLHLPEVGDRAGPYP